MKSLLVVLALGTTFSAAAQKLNADKVPAAVKESFAKLFPNVKDAKWEMEKKDYEANFKSEGKAMSANFSDHGEWKETETAIKSSELPKPAMEYVAQHHKGAKIKEAAMVKKPNGVTQYEIEVSGKDLIFDESGKLVSNHE